MTVFLTSSPMAGPGPVLNPDNGFAQRMIQAAGGVKRGLFISSDQDDHEHNDMFAADVKTAFRNASVRFTRFQVLDSRTMHRAAQMVRQAQLIVLAGGHVPTQNDFFQYIGLRELLYGFDGVIMGISAGTMNSADTVYAMPELEGEALDEEYPRWLPGLGLTPTMIIPHFQKLAGEELDGMRIIEDIAFPDSEDNCFICLPDGSYLLRQGQTETIYGEAWQIENGELTKLCENGESFLLA